MAADNTLVFRKFHQLEQNFRIFHSCRNLIQPTVTDLISTKVEVPRETNNVGLVSTTQPEFQQFHVKACKGPPSLDELFCPLEMAEFCSLEMEPAASKLKPQWNPSCNAGSWIQGALFYNKKYKVSHP